MPLLALLLLKLQGWVDHWHSLRNYEQAKVQQDVTDIREMLRIAVKEEVNIDDWDSKWMPRWFVNQMIERVEEHIRKFPGSQSYWEILSL
ncbi:hypothetical protein BT96DRAFT_917826 [Gymnopus androsaceus JB14]|uniref:Uncharacterized protein n=1 Tax=Gymnopus androsaceus JB14 TaxID=1447944 RepID=A0A6A4HZ81_9AGAR|nr:hypothetical protein BT96DRAFT_917826 [Gymnopus androsaceus JB14]